MPIPVVCPGCKASFRVSDKFAGKQGPCPKCKAVINVPMVEEVKIHVPEAPAAPPGKAAPGASIKPIRRKESKLSPVMLAALIGGSLGAVVLSLVLRAVTGSAVTVLASVGVVLMSPAICVGCYNLLRDDELEPHRGLALWIRATICGLVYAALWGAFAWLLPVYVQQPELWVWLFAAPPFFLVAGIAGLACFDFDYGTGVIHYTFYAFVTATLGMIGGIFPPAWVMGGG